MYNSATKPYYAFLAEQEKRKESALEIARHDLDVAMTSYMRGKGWTRKNAVPMKFTKTFNGKLIEIEFRCSFKDSYMDGGLPEFVHDRKIQRTSEIIKMGYFHWNDQPNQSGHSLDVVMERMEIFYDNYTK
jgi:hypothetical protein